MNEFSLAPIVVVLLVSVITVILCRKFNIPSMLGYLLVGFLAGPGMLSLIPKSHATDYLGEIGIVFLMFSIGLEFSLPKLRAMRRLVFGLGGLQVGVTMLSVMGILMLTGVPFNWAFAVSGALAMSSTAIVSRILSEKTELGQPHGQMAMGVLLMQDIAVVPLMILIPALAGGGDGNIWAALGLAFAKMLLTLGLLFFVGSKIMSRWFRMVAKRKSSELFMINVLLVTLGVAYLTELEGLSMALGAFVAGMLLSETEYRFQVEDDIRPFRDILLGFFFITVGMKLDIQALIGGWRQVLMLLAMLLVLKVLVVFAIAFKMKHSVGDSLKTALYLAQGGEFGFVMLAIAGQLDMVSPEWEQAATAAVLLSMIIAPFLLGGSDALVGRLVKSSWDMKSLDLHSMLVETMSKSDHVLIVGFGRGGQTVGRVLAQEDIPYFALDLDIVRVQVARSAGGTGVVRRCKTQGSIGSRRSGTGENGGGYAQQYARNATRFRQCAVHVSQYAHICARHQRRLCENVYRYRCGRSRVGHQRNRTRAGRLCDVRQRRVVSARLSDDGKYPPQPLCRVGGTVCRQRRRSGIR